MIRSDLHAMARMLGGEVIGGQILCPGPGHSRVDRSLCVKPDPHVPDRFITHSFAGDAWRDCDDHVRHQLHLPRWEKHYHSYASPRAPKPKVSAEPRASTARALRIFEEARALPGTIGEVYLARRVGGMLEWPADLRFHPSCARKVDGNLEHQPAVIVLLRDIRTDERRAIQRIFLKPDGSDRLRDAGGKMNLGPTTGTVAKMSRDDCVTHGLGIAEGVETALCLLGRGWSPIWATAGTPGMTSFPVLEGIESLTVFADHDNGGAGEAAAKQCIDRWLHAGHEAKGIKPRANGRDWANIAGGVP